MTILSPTEGFLLLAFFGLTMFSGSSPECVGDFFLKKAKVIVSGAWIKLG